MKIKFLLFIRYFFLVSLFIVFMPHYSASEFYQYINKDGVKCYTDDPSLVSDIDDKNITIYKGKYDGLNEEEKKKLKAQEAQRVLESEQKTREALNQYRRNQLIEDARKAKAMRLKKTTTPARIFQNRIIIPVTIGYSGREVTTELLLDTGASITVIHNSIAEQLEINTGRKSAARVADGGLVRTEIVEIEYIKVGPKTYKAPTIMVINKKGPAMNFNGLLGQDFLSHFNYTIDYYNSLIVWR